MPQPQEADRRFLVKMARDAAEIGRHIERLTKVAKCTHCGALFTSIRAHNHRWPKTCSATCRLAKLDNLIAGLKKRRELLAAEVEKYEGGGPSR